MLRIRNFTLSIPKGVSVELKNNNLIEVLGNLGKLQQVFSSRIKIEYNGEKLLVKRTSDNKEDRAIHGLYCSIIKNMFIGVTMGFSKELELVGIGYRAFHKNQRLELNLGFSHNIIMELPIEIKLQTQSEKGKNPLIILKSCDKQLLGLVAAKIYSIRKPDPYKGKGVRYVGKYIRRKAGKSA
ncbi:50S ribosomal protein L6 [Candidatus Walczuchella monophlebidarum]|uniref:50S ribosomal protein L6 n=1 Tax=Candidatus Walczuchella monophlebidarum TaxID=1415657 RepID=A0A068DWH2_9FLAO|nr:50S ribosomal protein L6 [Candidatus Walczuchella monophlebidarum]AID37358.1 Ribosomal protein L6 [Candidatus Walczuchella monophlebidarum]